MPGKAPINSHRIYFYTFGDFLRDLRGRLEDFQAWATRPPESENFLDPAT